MALSDVLTKLKNQRTAIVTAINGKGGTLGADATLADCAAAIGNISGGGADFYKCSALVAASEGGVQGQTLRMQGTENIGGVSSDITFTLEDATKTGKNRTWKSSDGEYRLLNKLDEEQDSGEYIWYIIHEYSGGATDNIWTSLNCPGSTSNDPWDMTEMVNNEDGMLYALTWTVSEASAGTPASWSGYKATQGDDGKYSFAETATTGLSYDGGFTPQVGTIYSQDAKVKVAQLMEAAAAIPQDGLVFWMPFDGSIEPRIGKVSAVGSTDTITYGNRAGVKYAILDRSCRWNMLDADGALFPQLSASAVSIIVYVNMLDVRYNYICRLMPIGANNYKIIGRTSASNWTVGGSVSSDTDCSPNKWHFVCFRQTSFNRSDDKNGEARIDTVTYPSSGSSAGNNQYMMLCGSNENGCDYKGSIFDFAIYNRYLTDAEVTALYQRVLPLQA